MRQKDKKTYLIGERVGGGNMDDVKIIELYFERNEEAIAKTETKYGKLCHNIAYNILNNEDDSDECVNDTYIGIWNSIPPTRPKNFMAFVCKIARNLSLKKLEYKNRQKRSQAITISFQELEWVLPDESFSPDISDDDIGKIISQFLVTQNDDVKKVFIRRYFFFDSIEEISKKYSFTESKVKNMLFRTRKKLKDYLIKEGVSL